MSIKITQPTTVKCYITQVSGSKVHFLANFGEGTRRYVGTTRYTPYFNGSENISNIDEDRKILFKITLEPIESGWDITSLVRQSDGKEFVKSLLERYAKLDNELL